jgi:hypothetical protein
MPINLQNIINTAGTGIKVTKQVKTKVKAAGSRVAGGVNPTETQTLLGIRFLESTGLTTKELLDVYGKQVAQEFEVHVFRDDDVGVGYTIYFNTDNQMLGTEYNPNLDFTQLEVKKRDYGYKDHKVLTCVSYN